VDDGERTYERDGGKDAEEKRRGRLYIACRVESHCLPVRTAQILPPSPERRARPYTYANSRIIRAPVRVEGARGGIDVGRWLDKWRVGISDKASHVRHTPLARARVRRHRSHEG